MNPSAPRCCVAATHARASSEPATTSRKCNGCNMRELGRRHATASTLMHPSSAILRRLFFTGALICLGVPASAHYFYEQFASSKPPFLPIVRHWDVNALPNGTVRFFISDTGPSRMAPGDSFAAIVSEIARRPMSGTVSPVPASVSSTAAWSIPVRRPRR